MNNKITVLGANMVLFVFGVLYVIFQFILTFLVALMGQHFLDDNLHKILLINQYVIILIPVVVYTLYKKLDIKDVFRLNGLKLIPAAIIVLLAVPVQLAGNMLNSLAIYLLQFLGRIPGNTIPAPRNLKELATGIAVVALSPAICEELMHRGIMLKAYEKRGTIKAVVISSIFFGLFHFDITNLLGTTFIGIVIGYYVVRTNSIFAGMLAHFLNNFIVELLLFFLPENMLPERYVRISPEELNSSVNYGMIGIVAIILLLIAFNRATQSKYMPTPSISSVRNDIISVVSHWPVIIFISLYVLVAAITVLTIALS